MQVVIGYLFGYLFIATVLLPLYYRLGLTSIYEYLRERIGFYGYKIGAFYFLLSRTIGASLRLFLVAIVLQNFVTGPMDIPFAATVAITILLIWLYTFRGGIKTIVYTDTLQTVCMLLSAGLTVYYLTDALEIGLGDLPRMISNSEYGQVFFFENGWSDPNNFWKQALSGALITIVMTGLDQDMMQKNLSMPNFRDAQKNMAAFSFVLIFANLVFLALGALLYIYATNVGLEIPASSDQLYPTVALRHLPATAGIIFVLGLIAAAYSSADSALTALTTSFCVDFLGLKEEDVQTEAKAESTAGTTDLSEVMAAVLEGGTFDGLSGTADAGAKNGIKGNVKRTRLFVHLGFSVLLFLVIMVVRQIDNPTIVNDLFTAAGYTYGPLLGLFAYGLFTRLRVRETFRIGDRIQMSRMMGYSVFPI
ncbi:MAG: sodium:solute symporter, partial [Bacteroidota bacterium]